MNRGGVVAGHMQRLLRAASLALLVACTPNGPIDPLVELTQVDLTAPSRVFVTVDDRTVTGVALALEFQSEVLLLNGSDVGELSFGDSFPVGQGPRSLAAADLDGDGRDDLVTANTSDSSISVLRRSDTGGFEPNGTVTLTAPPTFVAAADMDLDGAVDLIVSVGLQQDQAIEVWHGADGGFERRAAPIAVASSAIVSIGDLDGDEYPDAVAVLTASDQVALLINEGDGQLAQHEVIAVCGTPLASVVTDLDGDSRADVVVACRDGGIALLYDAAGERRAEMLAYTGNLYDAVARDIDGDGLVDLAAVDTTGHLVALWLRDDDGVYGEPFLHPVARGPIAIRAADVERDGDLDLLVLSIEQRALSVVRNATSP